MQKHNKKSDYDALNLVATLGTHCLPPDRFQELEQTLDEIRGSVLRRIDDEETEPLYLTEGEKVRQVLEWLDTLRDFANGTRKWDTDQPMVLEHTRTLPFGAGYWFEAIGETGPGMKPFTPDELSGGATRGTGSFLQGLEDVREWLLVRQAGLDFAPGEPSASAIRDLLTALL